MLSCQIHRRSHVLWNEREFVCGGVPVDPKDVGRDTSVSYLMLLHSGTQLLAVNFALDIMPLALW